MSGLTVLEDLDLHRCQNDDFVITGLPESLQNLYIQGLTEENFAIGQLDGTGLESLKTIQVTNASLCCLGADPLDCRYGRLGGKTECNLLNRVNKLWFKSQEEVAIMNFLRSSNSDGCLVERLDGRYISNFSLTPRDIEILQPCPLKYLDLSLSSCFPPSTGVDLSVLTSLRFLRLTSCRNTDFVITGLPDSLQQLDITGLTRTNFELDITGARVGKSLVSLAVTDASLCCPGVVYDRGLPQVRCGNIDGSKFFSCGLSDNGEIFGVVRKEDISALRSQINDTCRVEELVIQLPEFTMTLEDVSILEQCPLKHLYM